MDTTLVHASRTARSSPQYEGGFSGSCISIRCLGNNGVMAEYCQSFPAEHACCAWFDILLQHDECLVYRQSFGAFGSSHFLRLDKTFEVQLTVARDMWLI